jgi:hypothetical protein
VAADYTAGDRALPAAPSESHGFATFDPGRRRSVPVCTFVKRVELVYSTSVLARSVTLTALASNLKKA